MAHFLAKGTFIERVVFQAIQASLLIDLGQDASKDPSKKRKRKNYGPIN